MSTPSATNFGNWLAEQNYRYDELGDMAWLLTATGAYLTEGVTEDSAGHCLSTDEMKRALQLMLHAPRLLRLILRSLDLLHSYRHEPAYKVKAVKLLVEEAAAGCLGPHSWREIERAVSRYQTLE